MLIRRVEGSVDRACGRQCRPGVWKAVQTGSVEDRSDKASGKNCRCGRQTMLKGGQKRRSDKQCSKTVQTGWEIREFRQGVQQDSADRAGNQGV